MDNPRNTTILRDMGTSQHIAIVGGGLAGPLLAIALADAGFSVTIVDSRAEKIRRNAAFDGRSYALALTSCRLLRKLDLWQALAKHAEPILQIKVSEGRAGTGPGPFWLGFDHAEIEEGPMGHMIQDRHLRRALLDGISARDRITHIAGVEVIGQQAAPGAIRVDLASGATLDAAVLVGADGRESGTARRAGIKRMAWGYDQTALVAAIEHENPHHGIAHQFFMPPGPLALLPLPQNRCSIVWSEQRATAKAFLALSKADFMTVLRPRFGSFLGEIKLVGKRWSYPLGLSVAQEIVAERVALVADAAHGVHPLAGQGLNAGIRDIAALAQTLSEAAARGEDIGSAGVLARYQEWRRFDNSALAFATDGFNRLFSNDNPALRGLRSLGLGMVNRLPRARRGFIREAAGLTGELPNLMR